MLFIIFYLIGLIAAYYYFRKNRKETENHYLNNEHKNKSYIKKMNEDRKFSRHPKSIRAEYYRR